MPLDNEEIVFELEYLADAAGDEVVEHDLNALAAAFRPSDGPIGLEEGREMLNEQIDHDNVDRFIPTGCGDSRVLYANYHDYPTPPTQHIDLPGHWGWEWAHENEDGSYRGINVFPRD